MTAKQKKMAELKRQMALLESSDEEDIEEGEDSEILDVNDIEDQKGFDDNNQT